MAHTRMRKLLGSCVKRKASEERIDCYIHIGLYIYKNQWAYITQQLQTNIYSQLHYQGTDWFSGEVPKFTSRCQLSVHSLRATHLTARNVCLNVAEAVSPAMSPPFHEIRVTDLKRIQYLFIFLLCTRFWEKYFKFTVVIILQSRYKKRQS